MRRRHMEVNEVKSVALHSVLAIRSGRIIKTSKYLKSKYPLLLVANPQSSIPWHAVFSFLIPVLLAVLQVHCQGSNKSPFDTHLPNLLAFLFGILIYCFACYFNNITSQLHPTNLTIPSKVSAYLALFSGSLASASLISVLLPRSLELFVFIIWIIFLIIYFSLNPIMFMVKWLYLSSKIVASYIFGLWKHVIRRNYGKATIIV